MHGQGKFHKNPTGWRFIAGKSGAPRVLDEGDRQAERHEVIGEVERAQKKRDF
jgi:hypothetical protein